jgi:vaccinia related kinase
MAKSDMIDQLKKASRVKHVGLSSYIRSGSHVYRGQKYSFLVLDRCGEDLDQVFVQSGRFIVKTLPWHTNSGHIMGTSM